MNFSSVSKTVILVNFALALGACQSIKVEGMSEVKLPQSFETGAQDVAQDAAVGEEAAKAAMIPWHERIGEPLLEEAIKIATDSNYSLKALEENYLKSWHTFKTARSDLLPTFGIGGNGGYSKTENTNIFLGIKDPRFKPMFEGTPDPMKNEGPQGAMALKGEWDVDLFGKKKQDAEAAKYMAMGEEEKLKEARLKVSYEVARQFYRIVLMGDEIRSLERIVSEAQRMKTYAQGRYKAGETDKLGVMDSDEELIEAKTKLELAKMGRNVQEKTLLALMGRTSDTDGLLARIKALRPSDLNPLVLPEGQRPVDLIENRHGLKARLNVAKAALAQVSSAKRDRFPSIKLNFFFTGGQVTLKDLKDLVFGAGLLGLDVNLPIFTGGRISNNIKSKEHQLKAALHDFDAELVKTVNEINASYGAVKSLDDLETLKREKDRILASREKDSMAYFKAGEKQLDDVIKTRIKKSVNSIELNDLRFKKVDAVLKLYESLGGALEDNSNGDARHYRLLDIGGGKVVKSAKGYEGSNESNEYSDGDPNAKKANDLTKANGGK